MATKRKAGAERQRAPRGSITGKMILWLDRETEQALGEALSREQLGGKLVNASEWVRIAIRERAERQRGQE